MRARVRVTAPSRAPAGTAAVVGGSIGGLTAALLLRDAGWDVDVFERSATVLEGRGGGIVLHPATIRYLVERAGATPAEMGVPVRWLRYLDAAGRVAHRSRCDYRFTSYDTIYRRLLAAWGGSRYHLGEECVGLRDPDSRPSVELSSGRVAAADVVVFADGINSFGRGLLAPGAEPLYAGYVAWRGTLDDGGVDPAAFEALADAITYQVLPDGHVITYPIPGPAGDAGPGRLRNWLWYWNLAPGAELDELLTAADGTRLATSVPRGQVPPDRVEDFVRRARASLARELAEILGETPDPFIQVILDVAVERMAWGRVCLIGDAAFTARPHIASGTAKAAENAWTLSAALAGAGDDVPGALAEWSRGQTALGTDAVARSRDAGTRLQDGTWPLGEPLPYGLYRVGDGTFPRAS
ncbi:MAG TPA: 2,6-dihydroxypyridine 3-hydroxylase [Gaiellaceae bacterium]|nr:2,6-dihydroxypyridine 3-hydroxylase [Gaiellaceae bacterium]